MDFNGYNIESVLIVDDVKSDVDDIIDFFKDNECDVRFAESQEEAFRIINEIKNLDLVIIDLIFDDDLSCTIAKSILLDIKERFFLPIVVYTAHSDKFEYTLKDEFPGNMIISMDKTTFFDKDMISEWLSGSPTTRVALFWSKTVRKCIIKALWEIEELDDKGMSSLLQVIRTHRATIGLLGNREFINLLNKVLTREITKDTQLINEIGQILSEFEGKGIEINEPFKKFWRISAYDYTINNKPPFNSGDVIKFVHKNKYGVIVTPTCDIYNDDSNLLLKIVNGYGKTDAIEKYPNFRNKDRMGSALKNKINKYHSLRFAGPLFETLIFDFSMVRSIPKKNLAKLLSKGKIKRIFTIDSPHYEHMIQRYSSYHRIGVPTIPINH